MQTDTRVSADPQTEIAPGSQTIHHSTSATGTTEPSSAAIGKFTDGLKDLYATLVATRNLEIQLFWQRSNYFLVLNTGIALGFFNLKGSQYAPIFAGMGLVASLLWFWVTLGGKYWQTRWEQRLMDFEESHMKGLDFFSADRRRIESDVRRGMTFHPATDLKKAIYRMTVAQRPSVSYSMILLAASFALAWAGIAIIYLADGSAYP